MQCGCGFLHANIQHDCAFQGPKTARALVPCECGAVNDRDRAHDCPFKVARDVPPKKVRARRRASLSYRRDPLPYLSAKPIHPRRTVDVPPC